MIPKITPGGPQETEFEDDYDNNSKEDDYNDNNDEFVTSLNSHFQSQYQEFNTQWLKDLKRKICANDGEYTLPDSCFESFENKDGYFSQLKLSDDIWSLQRDINHWDNIVISPNRSSKNLPELSEDLNEFITVDFEEIMLLLGKLILDGM